ncbi:Alpha/Beta hydrolase protein [Scenedesmus sp. NREL 46B-D3]|nr:Alpha/Beta hydrolase protein [Scenedesmus sp. NREL 46B-D3]
MATRLSAAVWALVHFCYLASVSSSPSGVVQLKQQVLVGPIAGPNATSLEIVIDSAYYTRTTLQFPCQSIKCTGWLYVPKAVAGSSKPPVIVMGHGLGGDKTHLQHYAMQYVSAGFAVFSFDYRFWGDSDGEPRRWIAPQKQVEDWLSAVQFVQTDLSSSVDSSRLSLWGTSFGGGHVITIASKLGRHIKAVVSQVPHLDSRLASSLNLLNRGVLGTSVLAATSLADRAAEKLNGPYLYVPLAGPTGSLAIMQLHDDELSAYYEYKGLHAADATSNPAQDPPWRKFVTRARLASDPAMAMYSPIDGIHAATAPIMIVAGKKDGLCPYFAAMSAQRRARNATLVTYDCLHFDIYNPPWFQQAVDKEVEFLLKFGV